MAIGHNCFILGDKIDPKRVREIYDRADRTLEAVKKKYGEAAVRDLWETARDELTRENIVSIKDCIKSFMKATEQLKELEGE